MATRPVSRCCLGRPPTKFCEWCILRPHEPILCPCGLACGVWPDGDEDLYRCPMHGVVYVYDRSKPPRLEKGEIN